MDSKELNQKDYVKRAKKAYYERNKEKINSKRFIIQTSFNLLEGKIMNDYIKETGLSIADFIRWAVAEWQKQHGANS
jgi:hypothetical protein